MSGKRIDDHKFFAGSGSPTFPKGVHTKEERSADGAGELSRYEDTTEAIHSQQEMGMRKAKAHSTKPSYRN